MKSVIFFLAAGWLLLLSCTKEKTDYEAEIDTDVIEYGVFKEVFAIQANGHRISVEALNGTFYKGYNEIRLTVSNAQTNQRVHAAAATLLPIMASTDGSHASGPHRYDLLYRENDGYFLGYAVFPKESSVDGSWEFYMSYTLSGQTYLARQTVSVQPQPNKNLSMTTFTGIDNEQYIIALVAPQKPRIAENALVAGIYRLLVPSGSSTGDFPDPTQFSYAEVEGYTLLLDPRMPEPSMGNHSSPNNRDLTQQPDGLYHGVVNYTMTGNWTLNFMLQNQYGRIVKGTEVPTDFTPGVEGVKSELHINIVF